VFVPDDESKTDATPLYSGMEQVSPPEKVILVAGTIICPSTPPPSPEVGVMYPKM
jgi:hypothetical protein